MKKWIQKLLPDYAIRPLILALAANFIIYFGVSQLRDHLTFHSLALPVDDRIPFFAPFIIFYILAYVQWIINDLQAVLPGLFPVFSNYTDSSGSHRAQHL